MESESSNTNQNYTSSDAMKDAYDTIKIFMKNITTHSTEQQQEELQSSIDELKLEILSPETYKDDISASVKAYEQMLEDFSDLPDPISTQLASIIAEIKKSGIKYSSILNNLDITSAQFKATMKLFLTEISLHERNMNKIIYNHYNAHFTKKSKSKNKTDFVEKLISLATGSGAAEATTIPVPGFATGASMFPFARSANLSASVALPKPIKTRVMEESFNRAYEEVIKHSLSRCDQLKGLDEKTLAHQYHVLATEAYDMSCLLYGFKPSNAAQRGRHIHKIAEKIAQTDVNLTHTETCADYKHPFEGGIEQCFLRGMNFPFRAPGTSCFDLINRENGNYYDHKTGVAGISVAQHEKNVQNAPDPIHSSSITAHEVRKDGVAEVFNTNIHRPR